MARHQIPKIWRNDKEFLSLTYAASFAGYHKERLRQLIQENKLSAERINGVWFIEKSVLQNFITENTGVKRISELPKLDNDTQKNNSKSIYRFFSASSQKTDPWDALLLGDLAPKKYLKPFNPFKYLFSFKSLFSPLIIKSLVLFLIFATAGFFILRNPDAALAKYNDFKNALSKIVPASKEIAVLTLNSLKTKSADIRQDLSYVIDQTALVLDNSSVGIADIAKNSVSKFKSFSVSVSESLKNISQFKSSKVSKFQSFKVSKFQGFKISKFQDFKISKFLDFNFSKFQDFKLSISQGLNFPKLKNFKISKIQGLKLPKFQSFKFPNFANVVSERFQNIAESRPFDYVKNKVRIAGKETGSFTLDLKNKIEEVPLKVGKYAGSLTGRGADKAIEKTKETLVGIYDKTFEILGRLPEVPKEEEAAEEKEPRDLTILRSQGLEPATNQISTPEPKQQPTIAERVVTERVVERVLAGLSKTDLDLALSGVNARILAEVSELKKEIAKRANDNFAAIALTNRINQLSGVTISTATVSGVSGLTDADIPNDITATNYLPLSGGTLTGGLTISSGGATITGALSASSLSIPNASSSLSSIFNTLYIGGVATTTFSTTASSFDITANATTTLGTTGLNIGSDQFVIQQNSGRVGISTSSPSVTFHLEEADGVNTGLAIGGDGVTSSARFWIGDQTNLWRMQTSSGNLIYTSGALFGTNNGTERFRMQSTGNFGIASSTPWGLLSVNPDALGARVPSFVVGSSSATSFLIDNGGRVGIGTTSPGALFAVSGAGYLTNNLTADGIFRSNSASASVLPYASTTALTVSGTGFFGTASSTNLTVSALTSGRVPYITTAGAFTDDSDFTFDGSILTATNASTTALTVSGTASTTNQVFSAMTSGSVLFAGAGGLLSQDNANLFWDDTNNKLGIGSSTPKFALSINSTLNDAIINVISTGDASIAFGRVGTQAFFKHVAGGSEDSRLHIGVLDASFSDALATGNEYIMTFQSLNPTGLVGVGSSTPWGFFSINPNGIAAGRPSFVVGSSSATSFIIDTGGNVGVGTTTPRGLLGLNDPAGVNSFVIGSNTPKFILKESGNVGIGTANPAQLLEVNGGNDTTILIESTSAGSLQIDGIRTGDADVGGIAVRNSNTSIGLVTIDRRDANNSGMIRLRTANLGTIADRMNIMPNGNVGIASTSPWGLLSVNPNALGAGVPSFVVGSSSATSFLINNGGKVGIGTTSPTNTLSVNGLLYVGGSGTSTVENNFDILGTLHARTSYVGDLIFANGFRFTEADSAGINQALYLNSQFGSTTLAVLDNGNIGIGTTTPAYKLHVIGDVAATSFVNISTRSMKKDISYVGLEEQNGILNTIKGMKVAKYRYEFEDESAPLRIGLIAEESPQEVLSASGGGVDIYKLSTFVLSAVQAMQIDLEELTARVSGLEAGSPPSAGQAGVSMQAVLDYLASLGTTITNGLANFKDVIVASLTVGSADKPTGITLYDEVTGEPYCLSIASGITKTVAGVCSGLTTPPPSGGETVTTTVTADTTPPTITVIGNNPAEIEIGATYGDLGVTITDNVDSNLGYTASLDAGPELSQGDGLAIDTSAAGTHTITYTATDSAGNIATAERTVNIIDPNASTTPSN